MRSGAALTLDSMRKRMALAGDAAAAAAAGAARRRLPGCVVDLVRQYRRVRRLRATLSQSLRRQGTT